MPKLPTGRPMVNFNLLIAISLAYVAFLFVIAFAAEKQADKGNVGWLRGPWVYTLSLSVYCTAWTFYGAVGNAARSGLEFLTIYLGPTLVMIGWWVLLRRLVRIGRAQRITSIADMISSRYGKSNVLGFMVTVLAVIGTTPYIALQLQSVTLSLEVFRAASGEVHTDEEIRLTALWIAVGLAIFTIVFGTRKLDANERHHGVVVAIAVEAVVKLVALMAVGVFVVFFLAGGPIDMGRLIDESPIAAWQIDTSRWLGLIFLSGAAFLCLPRMFQVLVVENAEEQNLSVASWAFPLYLLLISLFVVPIAVMGLKLLPAGSNPDLFVLTLPLNFGQDGLAIFAFIGGFSSATSMVIVAALALSTMVSNNIVMPIWLNLRARPMVAGDVRAIVLIARRITIAVVLALGFIYYRVSGGGAALAAIGLISFAGVAQVLPAMVGGIFWRGATRVGAGAGVLVGFIIWAYTMFLPSFGEGVLMSPDLMAYGPWGIEWLRPRALFGIEGIDPVVHAVIWSMLFNSGFFIVGSFMSFPNPLERLQAAQFVEIWDRAPRPQRAASSPAVEPESLLVMAQRILGAPEAQTMFERSAAEQGKTGYLPEPTPEFIETLERELAGSVGAATAHAMLGQMISGDRATVEDLMKVADEAAQIMEYSSQLEAKSAELERTMRQLTQANEKLTALSVQKDAFLSQVSHELRTPMTSIRSFSEILMDMGEIDPTDRTRYSNIIHDETLRLTRLLDDLLDLSVLENGQVSLNVSSHRLGDIIDRALDATGSIQPERDLSVVRDPSREDIIIETDPDRLAQVLINLIANAKKYCDAENPILRIAVRTEGADIVLDLVDNGSGVPLSGQTMIFEKFSRLSDQSKAGGAGLGLAICREIMANLGGSISYLPGQGGGAFRLRLPVKFALTSA
jgi:Na+/proline symporter/nitrogen-specific signal transduction histidine kinase